MRCVKEQYQRGCKIGVLDLYRASAREKGSRKPAVFEAGAFLSCLLCKADSTIFQPHLSPHKNQPTTTTTQSSSVVVVVVVEVCDVANSPPFWGLRDDWCFCCGNYTQIDTHNPKNQRVWRVLIGDSVTHTLTTQQQLLPPPVGGKAVRSNRHNMGNLVDPASSHMLVSRIKPCMSKYEPIIR